MDTLGGGERNAHGQTGISGHLASADQPIALQPDMDPYAPSIVQDLLAGASEWRNI